MMKDWFKGAQLTGPVATVKEGYLSGRTIILAGSYWRRWIGGTNVDRPGLVWAGFQCRSTNLLFRSERHIGAMSIRNGENRIPESRRIVGGIPRSWGYNDWKLCVGNVVEPSDSPDNWTFLEGQAWCWQFDYCTRSWGLLANMQAKCEGLHWICCWWVEIFGRKCCIASWHGCFNQSAPKIFLWHSKCGPTRRDELARRDREGFVQLDSIPMISSESTFSELIAELHAGRACTGIKFQPKPGRGLSELLDGSFEVVRNSGSSLVIRSRISIWLLNFKRRL